MRGMPLPKLSLYVFSSNQDFIRSMEAAAFCVVAAVRVFWASTMGLSKADQVTRESSSALALLIQADAAAVPTNPARTMLRIPLPQKPPDTYFLGVTRCRAGS